MADIAAGIFVGGFGLDMVFHSSMFLIMAWLPIMLVIPFKKLITYPRIGYIQFAPERRRKTSKGLAVLSLAGVLSAGLGLIAFLAVSGELVGLKEWFDTYSPLLLGAIIASGFLLVAFLFQISRFYVYAFIEFGAWLISHLLDIDLGLPVALSGAIMLLVGAGLLIRFLTANPVPAE